eukprot:GEMP01017797.1.p1 GENE.GEMP01017797.1~~GEMP01017797.1.p1  ORF type:complete len:360 (+),score=114.53 GEMP01017797.1:212-1291(+)
MADLAVPLMPTQGMEEKARKSQDKLDSQAVACQRMTRLTRGVVDMPTLEELEEDAEGEDGNRDSQIKFAHPEQTIIIFDWDDTLFPTTWIRHDKNIHWRYPLAEQTNTYDAKDLAALTKQLKLLQDNVEKVLTLAMKLGHVVIVTLARPPWVELSCDNFFTHIGRFVTKHGIKVVYAQDMDGKARTYDKQKFASSEDAERFWIQKKQNAIMGEIADFYSKSASSWKNVISLGDSDFERFATQASLLDYATVDDTETEVKPEVGSAAAKLAVLSPSHSKSKKPDNYAVSGWVGKHYRRLRCKTVKMFDSPSCEDLATEMSMLHKWIPFLVKRDAGFDVDLEDEEELYDAHYELTGEKLST